MADELSVIPSALSSLLRELSSPDTQSGTLYLHLRALQHLGLSQSDLRVHIERIRAINDVTTDDPDVEDNALLALDMVTAGTARYALRWDAAEIVKILLPQVLSRSDIATRMRTALTANNMLPPRPEGDVPDEILTLISEQAWNRISNYESEPQPVDFFRVPKTGMTSRPAALLTPEDRLIYEGLASRISAKLDKKLPPEVAWPRGEDSEAPHLEFAAKPKTWQQAYVVVTDIDSFYECIDHSVLASMIDTHFSPATRLPEALESFLNVVMRSSSGLPQGPPASDILASTYLLEVDTKMAEQEWTYARYADDYLISVNSVSDGRQRIETLESALQSLGLRLNTSKTKVMRREKYLQSLTSSSPRIERFRQSIRRILVEQLRSSEDPHDVDEILTRVGADEERIWDLLYHQSTTIDEVIEEIRELLLPPLADAYAEYLKRSAIRLRRGMNLPNMPDLERDLKECLTFLAGARQIVDLSAIDQVFRWFPRLAPNVASYLKTIVDQSPHEVANFLNDWLTSRSESDWVTAWICHVPEAVPGSIPDSVLYNLRSIVNDERYGLLTRSAGVRALAASRRLDHETWRKILTDASPAVRSELIFARMASPEKYPAMMDEVD
ncbi:RNA-directed DNA polymerase [Actinomadura sp. ATCC 39365]